MTSCAFARSKGFELVKVAAKLTRLPMIEVMTSLVAQMSKLLDVPGIAVSLCGTSMLAAQENEYRSKFKFGTRFSFHDTGSWWCHNKIRCVKGRGRRTSQNLAMKYAITDADSLHSK